MIIYPILLTVLPFICFFLCVYCYILGVKHGRVAQNGGTPRIPNPVAAIKTAVEEAEAEKEAKELDSEFGEIMSLSRESMMDAIDKKRDDRMGRG